MSTSNRLPTEIYKQRLISGLEKAQIVRLDRTDCSYYDVTEALLTALGVPMKQRGEIYENAPERWEKSTTFNSDFSFASSEVLYYLTEDIKVGVLHRVSNKLYYLAHKDVKPEEVFMHLL